MKIEIVIMILVVVGTLAYLVGWYNAYRFYTKKYKDMVDRHEKILSTVNKLTNLIRSAFPEIDEQLNKEEGPGEF